MTDDNDKKVLLSGIKPTGKLHVGNYFGAMRQFVELQNNHESYVFIANYHALTTVQSKEELMRQSLDIALDYLAVGLDPTKTNLFLQTDVPEVTELAWIFDCITTMPYLMRAHAYKDAVAKNKKSLMKNSAHVSHAGTGRNSDQLFDIVDDDAQSNINVGLFNYPMLMAADILIQNADVVPVGKDQKQHVEIARDTAEKFNRMYGETFKIPEPLILEDVETVPGIDGQKMSKSYNNTIPLFGTDGEIKKQVAGIVTDSKTPEEQKDPIACNIFALHKLFSTKQLVDIEKRYKNGGIGYKESKDILAENIIKFISPMRAKREEMEKEPETVIKILKNGGEKARSRARLRMADVKSKIGLI